jgi:hypothetical protein
VVAGFGRVGHEAGRGVGGYGVVHCSCGLDGWGWGQAFIVGSRGHV